MPLIRTTLNWVNLKYQSQCRFRTSFLNYSLDIFLKPKWWTHFPQKRYSVAATMPKIKIDCNHTLKYIPVCESYIEYWVSPTILDWLPLIPGPWPLMVLGTDPGPIEGPYIKYRYLGLIQYPTNEIMSFFPFTYMYTHDHGDTWGQKS